jgi:hypothetical protein
MQRISVALEKPVIRWSNTMDMIAIHSTPDRVIELHRVGYKHQKVFAKEDLVGPTAVAFLDSTPGSAGSLFQMAVGFEDGKVTILNGENAEELFTTKISDFGSPITSMHWQDISV